MQAIPKEDISDTPHYPASRTILLISAFSIPSQTSFSPWWCTKDAQVFQKLESICWEGTSDCNLRLHQIHLIALHMDYEINTTPRGPVLNHCLNSTVLHYALFNSFFQTYFIAIKKYKQHKQLFLVRRTKKIFTCQLSGRRMIFINIFNFLDWNLALSIFKCYFMFDLTNIISTKVS